MWRNIIICLLLAVVTYAVYQPLQKAEFINFDDPGYVVENQHVQAGLLPKPKSDEEGRLDNIWWAITTTSEFNWHPLTWLSYMLDCDVYNWYLKTFPNQKLILGQAGGFHMTSVLMHVATSVLLFLVMWRLTKIRWASAVVAALFALHPQHVESVAWVAERKDVLSGFFWILTMGVYALYVERRDWKRFIFYGLVLVCAALGLMAKPMVVTLPFALLLLDFWPLRRLSFGKPELLEIDDDPASRPESEKDREAESPDAAEAPPDEGEGFLARVPAWVWVLLEKVPLFAMIVGSSILTYFVQQEGGAMTYAQRCPLYARLMNLPLSYVTYLFKTFVPVNLAVFYPYNHEPVWWHTALAGALLAAITALVIWQVRRRPYLAVGWFWFLGTLVPVIGLVQVGAQAMADRYTYIPTLGLFFAAVFGLREAVIRYRNRPQASVPVAIAAVLVGAVIVALWITSSGWLAQSDNHEWAAVDAPQLLTLVSPVGGLATLLFFGIVVGLVWRYDRLWALAPLAAGAVAALVALTAVQVAYWPNTKILFEHALDVEPHNAVAHCNLGESMFLKGQYPEAEFHFREALKIDDEQTGAHNNLGWSLARRGLIDEAIKHYIRSLEIDPKNAAAHNNYALALAAKGQTEEAIKHLETALTIEKDYGAAHNNLGMILADQGKFAEAADHYRKAIRINPADLVARTNLGLVLSGAGKPDEAVEVLQAAIAMDQRYPPAHNNLGLVYCRMGKFKEAVDEYTEALHWDPNQAGTHNNLGMALAQVGQTDAAIAQFREALRLEPKQPDARMNLAQVLRGKGEVAESVRLLREGLQINSQWPQALSMLAWILATDPRFVAPEEALTRATAACELTNHRDAQALDALGAAYAACNRFREALAAAQEALAAAHGASRPDLEANIRSHLATYQSGKQVWQVP